MCIRAENANYRTDDGDVKYFAPDWVMLALFGQLRLPRIPSVSTGVDRNYALPSDATGVDRNYDSPRVATGVDRHYDYYSMSIGVDRNYAG